MTRVDHMQGPAHSLAAVNWARPDVFEEMINATKEIAQLYGRPWENTDETCRWFDQNRLNDIVKRYLATLRSFQQAVQKIAEITVDQMQVIFDVYGASSLAGLYDKWTGITVSINVISTVLTNNCKTGNHAKLNGLYASGARCKHRQDDINASWCAIRHIAIFGEAIVAYENLRAACRGREIRHGPQSHYHCPGKRYTPADGECVPYETYLARCALYDKKRMEAQRAFSELYEPNINNLQLVFDSFDVLSFGCKNPVSINLLSTLLTNNCGCRGGPLHQSTGPIQGNMGYCVRCYSNSRKLNQLYRMGAHCGRCGGHDTYCADP